MQIRVKTFRVFFAPKDAACGRCRGIAGVGRWTNQNKYRTKKCPHFILFSCRRFCLFFYYSDNAILFGGVRCTFWALSESLKPGGMVNNFVMAAFCYYLYNKPSGHPNVSKCHFFFSNIAVSAFYFYFLGSTWVFCFYIIFISLIVLFPSCCRIIF